MEARINPEEYAIANVNALSLDTDVDAHINKTMKVYQAAYDKAVEFNKENGFDNESDSTPVEFDSDAVSKLVKKPKF